MDLADKYMAIVSEMRTLATQLLLRNPQKLLAAARGKIPGATLRLAQLALEDNVGKQVMAPAYKSTGKSAAEGPNQRLQGDLIDYSQNTKGTKAKYALMLSDVYTREVRAMPLLNKQPSTVNNVMQQLLPTLVEDNKNFAITTDLGGEFSRLSEGGIPTEATHRLKKASNDIAVLDRAMQTVKVDSAAAVASGSAKNWVEALDLAVDAHNKRPHETVHGPPETVETRPEQDFRVLQDNAKKRVIQSECPK